MKAKNILMSILLVMGSIAAKAAGYPPELALVSQPVMVYNSNSITVYYDVENIGDYTYRGNVYIYLDPDYGYSYADKYVKVRPGRIKRIAVEIPSHSIDRYTIYTIMPYYSMGNELYSFTTFEYFDPIRFWWHGPRTEPWVVINIGPCPRFYHRPGSYRYYYDGFRPPMPPPPGHGSGTPPPSMDPMHHTYGYHHNNGGYPANHEWNNMPEPKPNDNGSAPSATVRPKPNGGSMSSGHYNNGTSTGSGTNNPPAPTPNGGSSSRPKVNDGASTGSATGHSSSGRTGNTGSSSGRVNGSNSNSRPSGTNGSSSGRVNNSNSSTRNSGTNGSSSSRVGSSNSNTRSSGSSSSSSSSTSSSTSSSSSSSSRSGSGSGRR